MKKNVISGLFVVLFTGLVGFTTVSEAVESLDDNQMDTFEMRHKHGHQRGFRAKEERKVEARKVTKEEVNESQEKWEKGNNDSYNRRENSNHNQVNNKRQNHHDTRKNYCH
ncbi:hypothetical protein [Enterococcus sp. AZ101]|uniref:hypothetical protein n=1 Tax=Enterococcus sp. AZ101 TaxID=2774742 RepID=UPI003D2A11F0